jgi:hypothetical protein
MIDIHLRLNNEMVIGSLVLWFVTRMILRYLSWLMDNEETK